MLYFQWQWLTKSGDICLFVRSQSNKHTLRNKHHYYCYRTQPDLNLKSGFLVPIMVWRKGHLVPVKTFGRQFRHQTKFGQSEKLINIEGKTFTRLSEAKTLPQFRYNMSKLWNWITDYISYPRSTQRYRNLTHLYRRCAAYQSWTWNNIIYSCSKHLGICYFPVILPTAIIGRVLYHKRTQYFGTVMEIARNIK